MDERFPRINAMDFCKQYSKNIRNTMFVHLTDLMPISGNISLTELFSLVVLIQQFQPQVVMEFGTFDGRTTLNLAMNLDSVGGRVYTVDLPKNTPTKFPLANGKHDPNDELGYIGLQNKLFHGKKTTAPIYQIWSDTAKLPVEEYRDQIDFLFVDASHSYDNAFNDSLIAIKIVKEGGVIAWHDYNGWPGVTRALHEFSQLHPWMPIYWLHDTSIVVSWNNKRKEPTCE